jgi:hypothetical protein
VFDTYLYSFHSIFGGGGLVLFYIFHQEPCFVQWGLNEAKKNNYSSILIYSENTQSIYTQNYVLMLEAIEGKLKVKLKCKKKGSAARRGNV